MDSMTMNIRSSMRRATAKSGPAWRTTLAACAVLSLGGCMTDRVVTGSIVAEDYHERHPIVVTERPTNLDIYVVGGLDRRTRARLVEFGEHFRSASTSRIEILVPAGSPNEAAVKAALPAIRQALAEGGATGYVSVGNYPADPHVAAPVRLSFIGIKGAVATKCGEWPADLASASSIEGWNNRPYWNMGCAAQNNLAAQVADPRDLVEPQAMGNGDVEMRIRAIGKVRQGSDPGTNWLIKTTPIGSVGGG
jgi:pilus assembly protein CpaD